MSKTKLAKNALEYHESGSYGSRNGKIEVVATKPCLTQLDLSLAYTPGVAVPCLEIEKNPEDAYKYTAKGNLVAVVTNGTAVLGLGDIGAMAGKPVMEGKGVLFKRFADVDVFDIELNSKNTDEIIKACQLLEPTFGGINLEDIKAPECFIIEEELKKTMNIPVFHDDQHGTAIIGAAALLNALKIVGKKIENVKVTMNGAGASGIAIATLIHLLGVKKENFTMCDTKGVIYHGRKEGMNKYKERFATDSSKRTLNEAIDGCDVLFGLSARGAFNDSMIKSMAANPIIMAMANPDPEITPEEVKKIRNDALMATGRSDYPNQVNNILGFPFIFRGALDVRATTINEDMKIAATYALAELAQEEVPESVCRAYGVDHLEFGMEYILPKPFDPRVLTKVTMAVAKAAMDSGVATKPIKDFNKYKAELEARLYPARAVSDIVVRKAKKNKAKVGFAHGEKRSVVAAAYATLKAGIATPILTGDTDEINATAKALRLNIDGIKIIDPNNYNKTEKLINKYYEKFWRSGVTMEKATKTIKSCKNRFAASLLNEGEIDCLIAYTTRHIPETVQAIADIVDLKEDFYTVSTSTVVCNRDRAFIIADPNLYTETDSESLAEVIIQTKKTAKLFDFEPKIAIINNSNFGDNENYETDDIKAALEMVKVEHPNLVVDGDMSLDTAIDPKKAAKYPLSSIKGDANVLIFSNIVASHSVIQTLTSLGGYSECATILQGFEHPVQIVKAGTDIEDILTLVAAAVASL